MSTADKLLEQMFSSIELRERCAETLKKLAQELESLRGKCNVSECVGSSAAVAGGACLIAAGMVTLFTGGAAAPLLGLAGGVCSGAGVGLSVGTKITEHFLSSGTLKEAQEIDRKASKIAEEIQKLFEQLKAEGKQTNPSADTDDLEQYMMTEILKAMARRSGLLNQFICMLDDQKQPRRIFNPILENTMLHRKPFILKMRAALAGILSCFSLTVSGKQMKLLIKGGQQLLTKLSKTGLKTALKGGAMVVGGAVGIVFELPEAIDNWKDLIKKNHVTEASKSLSDTADELQKLTQTLRKQLNDIKRPVENQTLIHWAIKMCKDGAVSRWLKVKFQSGAFLKLGDIFKFLKKHIDEEEKKDHSDRVHITFVAHGAIRDSMIPANCVLPLSSIEDVVLYSPWNCTLCVDAAYAVATGIMELQHRVFNCNKRDGCQIPDEEHRPTNLPDDWNKLKRAGDQKIPNIILSPLKPPTDGAFKRFESLTKQHGPPKKNHIIIPYILPAEEESSQSVPFYVVSLALSLALLGTRFKATVHLTTCLGDQSAGQKFDKEYLKSQYAYTINNTSMTADPHVFRK